jgi:hypothetical protein
MSKFISSRCNLASLSCFVGFSPARFGLLGLLICSRIRLRDQEAAAHLTLVLGTSLAAVDALVALGLLEVKAGKKPKDGLAHMKKVVDLDPLHPDLIVFETIAL